MQQERATAGAFDQAKTAAVWPGARAAGRIATIFAAGALVGITWSPGSPFRDLQLPALTIPPLSLAAIERVIALPPPAHAPERHLAPAPATAHPEPAIADPELHPHPVSAAVPTAPAAPAAAAPPSPSRPEWQSPDVPRVPFPQRVERWRPLVRMILAEMWQEGRLDGHAARLDDDLVLALIQQESAGRPDATSWVGAIGLMQVMPFTFAEMMHGDKSLADQIDPAVMYDLTSNVRAGLRYLALAMQATEGNHYWALAAYNGGIEAVSAWRAVGLYAVPPIGGYQETASYAQVILRNYLAHRPDVQMHVPDPMPYEHVPGAVELLLQAGRY